MFCNVLLLVMWVVSVVVVGLNMWCMVSRVLMNLVWGLFWIS